MMSLIIDCTRILIAACYRAAYLLHHVLFLRPGKPLRHARLIVVGSFRAGGAGKTPFCIWLVRHILERKSDARVAILCHRVASDEVNLVQSKFPDVRVVATANRYRTACQLDDDFDYIICDDGFEDPRLVGAATVRLDWGDVPTLLRDLVPVGRNRSLLQDHDAPAVTLACSSRGTETPADISFTLDSVGNACGEVLLPKRSEAGRRNEVLLPKGSEAGRRKNAVLCGIGNPERFVSDLTQAGFRISRKIFRADHDRNFDAALRKALADGGNVIMTEKDYARIHDGLLKENERVYIASQTVSVNPEKIEALDTILFAAR